MIFFRFIRIRIVALHFKENTQKAQATTHEGHQCFVKVYPKAKEETEAVVQPRSLEPTFGKIYYYTIYLIYKPLFNSFELQGTLKTMPSYIRPRYR